MAMTSDSVMTLTFEGIVQQGGLVFSHTFPNEVQLVGYRILSRVAPASVPITININNNGVTLGSMVLNSGTTDSGEQGLGNLYFYTGDQIQVIFSGVGPVPLEGQSLIIELDAQMGDSLPGSQSFNCICTPMLPRYEGILQVDGTSFFSKTFDADILLTNCRMLLRIPTGGQSAIINIVQNGTVIQAVSILSGVTDSGNIPLSLSFSSGDTVQLVVAQTGIFEQEGMDLTFILDYSNLSQTTFVDFQVPFIISSDAIFQNSLIFRYNLPRTVTFVFGSSSLRNNSTSPVSIGIYKNGALQSTIVTPIGNNISNVSQFAIQYNQGDLLEVIPLSEDNIAAGLVVCLDNTVNASQPNFASFVYMSDPLSSIVLMMRTLGIGVGQADCIRPSDVPVYQGQVDNMINSMLSPLYRCPLNRVNRPFQTSPWPYPIQPLAQRLVLRNILNDNYSLNSPNSSASSPDNEKLAYELLTPIISKQVILDGQKLRSRNYGSSPWTEPLTSTVQATQNQG